MPRAVLDEDHIHPAIRDRVAGHHADVVDEVRRAIAVHPVVVVGCARTRFHAARGARSRPPVSSITTSSTAATSASGDGAMR